MAETEFLIESLVARLREDFALKPLTASEIEFYLSGATAAGTVQAFWDALLAACKEAGVAIFSKGAETGKDQFEVALAPVASPLATIAATEKLKGLITTIAGLCGLTANFAAKLFADQPGSGLHMHLSLLNAEGKNTFFKNDYDISPQLKHSIGGLVLWAPECMPVFAPTEASYARFIGKSNAPINASWGANNRTTAIRLPDAPHDDKHIELRTAGADADPALVMAIMLAAVHYGMKYKCDPGAQVYGDASMPSYDKLSPLPNTLEAATARMLRSPLVPEYFNVQSLLPKA